MQFGVQQVPMTCGHCRNLFLNMNPSIRENIRLFCSVLKKTLGKRVSLKSNSPGVKLYGLLCMYHLYTESAIC